MENRYFASKSAQGKEAKALYDTVKDLPLICPHGHVDPRILADPDYQFGTPVDLLIIPDHYIFRMMYSQGVALESLGIERRDGNVVEQDHRKIWQTICDHWYLMRGTPTYIWLRDELRDVFGIEQKINSHNAQGIYDELEAKLTQAEFSPRQLFKRFNIEALATTDLATDRLEDHQAIRNSDWNAKVVPTFRPDTVVNIETEDWVENIETLSNVSGIAIHDYASYIQALEQRRTFFKSMGAVATDHAALTAYTALLTKAEAEAIFQKALKGQCTAQDAIQFTGHMLIEMARMSSEDGLVMQFHIGAYRSHNPSILERFGHNMGADIPTKSEFTRNLKPLLDIYGNHPDLTLILFNLDETTYGRELAPLAGHYPILRLGPPWWFFDSLKGMRVFLDDVVETAGIYNTVGFNDDTRAYPSIATRHDVWRRACADWLANLLLRHIIDAEDAHEMMIELAYGLAKKTYNL